MPRSSAGANPSIAVRRYVGPVRRAFVQEAWEASAEELLARFDDQPFSYVDATSFVAMRQLGLMRSRTTVTFATAGFTVVRD